jgi:hypothetical protein
VRCAAATQAAPVGNSPNREFTPHSQFFRFRAGKRAVVAGYRIFNSGPFLLAPGSLQDVFEDRGNG